MSDLNRLPTVVDIFRQRCDRSPGRTVYICAEPPITPLTYAALGQAARAVASELQRRGLRKGQCALLVFPPESPHFPIALWGCLLAGVVAVPVVPPNPLTLAADVATLSRISENCRARVALTDERYRRIVKLGGVSRFVQRMAGRSEARWPELEWLAIDRVRGTDREEPLFTPIGPNDLAYLQYTSGSTGHPKGVEIRHSQLLANLTLMGQDAALTENEVLLWWVPWWHDMGLVAGFLNAVYHGCCGIFYSPLSFLKNPASWLEFMHRWKVTGISAPGFGYDLASRRVGAHQGAEWDLSSVRLALLGGEVARPETVKAFATRFARNGFRNDIFHNVYGMAESTLYICGIGPNPSQVMMFDKDRMASGHAVPVANPDPDASVALLSLGCPSERSSSALVAVREGVPCGPGQVGELWLSSPSLSQAYHGNAEATHASFGARLNQGPPHLLERRFLRTGDMGFHWNGQFFMCGRLKDMIIVGGRNIYPTDIEDSVRECDARIRPGGVAAFGLAPVGAELERVVVLAEVRELGLERKQLDEVLHAIQQTVLTLHRVRCAAVALVPPGSILKTSSGKVRRQANREAFSSGKLTILRARHEAVPSEPSPQPAARPKPTGGASEYEGWIVGWLATTLNLPVSAVHPDAKFLALGADSLAMVQLSMAIGEAFGLELAPEAPWHYPTPRSLAAHVAAAVAGESGTDPWSVRRALWEEVCSNPAPARGVTLTPRERTWLKRIAHHGNHPEFALRTTLPLPSPFSSERLVQALQRTLCAESSLRTCYPMTDPPEYLVIADVLPEVQVHDVTALSLEEGRSHTQELFQRLAGEAIPVEQAPLLRLDAVVLNGGHAQLMVRVHHLVADGVTLGLLSRRLLQAYLEPQALPSPNHGEEAPTARAFAEFQQRYFQTPEGAQRRDEAAMRLDRIPPTSWSPIGREVTSAAGSPMQRKGQLCGADRHARWTALARQEAVSLSVLLGVGYSELLRSLFRQPGIGLQAVANLRHVPFLSEMLGDLANDYGLVCDAPESLTFRELLKHLELEDRTARAYQDVPWAWLGHTEAAFTFQIQQVQHLDQDTSPANDAEQRGRVQRLTSWRDGLAVALRILPLPDDVGVEVTILNDLCPASGVEGVLDSFLQLMDRLLEEPDQPARPLADVATEPLRLAWSFRPAITDTAGGEPLDQ